MARARPAAGRRQDQVETLAVIATSTALAPVVYAGLALHLALAGFVVTGADTR